MFYRISLIITKRLTEHEDYFISSSKDIALKNLKLLKKCSIITSILILAFILFTPLLFPMWTASGYHLIFMCFAFVFTIISQLCGKVRNSKVITGLCILFWCGVMTFLTLIDTVVVPSSQSNFFPIIFIALPIVFIFRFRLIVLVNILLETMYIVCLSINKTGSIKQNDIFCSILSFIVSLILSLIVLSIRIEENSAKQRYKQLSKIDYLTSLYNKNTCESIVSKYLANRDPQSITSLIVMDIDNFKMVNDKYGHSMGDRILEDFSHCLLSVFGSKNIVGRIGGDEFLVLVKDIAEESIIPIKCRELQKSLRRIDYIDGFEVNCSIGAAIVSDCKSGYFQLFELADNALYDAKNSGKNRFVLSHLNKENFTSKPSIALIDYDDVERAVIHNALCKDFDIKDGKYYNDALNILNFLKDSISGIVLDFYSKNIDSYELIKYMKSKQEFKDIPIIAIMANDSCDDKLLKQGISEIIIRPVDEKKALLKIQGALMNNIMK